jgi:zinc transport system ATP-binding protein
MTQDPPHHPDRTTGAPTSDPHHHSGHHNHHGHGGHDHSHDHDHDADMEETEGPAAPHSPDALLSARGLSFSRMGRSILQRVDLNIAPSEIVTLIGPNGAGKTTLVRLLLGIEAPTSGSIARKVDLAVGYVPQRFDLDRAIPMTVDRFLSLGKPRNKAAVRDTLSEVGASGLTDRQFTQLSGGELQRILIARALLREPTLLVLDEPVRGVDYAGEAELYTLISRLRTDRSIGILLVSHDLHVVMASSDRVICLNRHVCCSGVPQSVAKHPEYARLFGPQAARAFALYEHSHDHSHALSGEPLPLLPTDATAAALKAAAKPRPGHAA